MSLQIGKAIYHILSNSKTIADEVEDKIFPLVATEGTTFPFIVYKRNGINPLDVKGRMIIKESVNIQVLVASDNYNKAVEIADKVRSELEKSRGMFLGIKIDKVTLLDADEDYTEDTHIQTLTFKIDIL